jgi:hypothetical protein
MDFNSAIRWLLKSRLHRLVSDSFMLVQYSGRKSGKEFAVPVNYIRKDRHLYVMSFKERSWWRNMKTVQPTLRLRGKDVPARAEVLDTPERTAAGLLDICSVSPGYRRFLKVSVDEQGKPKMEDLRKAADNRVVVKFTPRT